MGNHVGKRDHSPDKVAHPEIHTKNKDAVTQSPQENDSSGVAHPEIHTKNKDAVIQSQQENDSSGVAQSEIHTKNKDAVAQSPQENYSSGVAHPEIHTKNKDAVAQSPQENYSSGNVESAAVEEKEQVKEQAPKEAGRAAPEPLDDNEVFGDADVTENKEISSTGTSVTDATRVAEAENAWSGANPADMAVRPHLVRLFSRDAPGRQDNTFKERPSESDDLHTIDEDTASGSDDPDTMSSQKHSTRGQGSKLASASFHDHSRHGYGSHGRYRDSGLLESLGRFFGGDKERGRRGSRKDYHASRASHVSYSPQKYSQHGHGRYVEENPVVHFFRNIVSPRSSPQMQQRGAEGQKPSHGAWGSRSLDRHYHHKTSHKGYKDPYREGTFSRLFNLGGRHSRSGSPVARR